jgi:glycosyltransferase involved in cell wall biosynthesis
MPAYNEESFIGTSLEGLLRSIPGKYEILVVENGSTDQTRSVVERMAEDHPRIRLISLPRPSYGQALRKGLAEARGEAVVVFNVDFWDLPFLHEALRSLRTNDVVVGSKSLATAEDHRPVIRKVITRAFNLALALLFGFRGTDTHGIKVFRRRAIEMALPRCRTRGEIFDTEMILRCQRMGLRMAEIPVAVREERPSRYGLLRRIPSTARDLLALFVALHGWEAP